MLIAFFGCFYLPIEMLSFKGLALSLLLAGPALSLPNMLVICGVIGTKKTVVYVSLVVIMATISGIIFGTIIKQAERI